MLVAVLVLLSPSGFWAQDSKGALRRLLPVFQQASKAKTAHFIEKDTLMGETFEYWIKKPNLVMRKGRDGKILVKGPGGAYARTRNGSWTKLVDFNTPDLIYVFPQIFNKHPDFAPEAEEIVKTWNGKAKRMLRWSYIYGEPGLNTVEAYFDAQSLKLLLVKYSLWAPHEPGGYYVGRYVYPMFKWDEYIPDSRFGPALHSDKRN